MEATPQLTQLLHAWRAGDDAARDALIPMVYERLHSIAARHMRGERPSHTLSPTALVSEAWLRLEIAEVNWHDRAHFLAIAAVTMRRILVDYAKTRQRDKRGSGAILLPLEEGSTQPVERRGIGIEQMLDLDEALTKLTRQDARKSSVLELVYFGGLNCEEAAEVLHVSIPTVNRDLRLAKAWLRHELSRSNTGASEAS